jgi:hypothetical protein
VPIRGVVGLRCDGPLMALTINRFRRRGGAPYNERHNGYCVSPADMSNLSDVDSLSNTVLIHVIVVTNWLGFELVRLRMAQKSLV